MEAAHAHLRTLDWVLHQEPYDGSDAQESVDREEEMMRMREMEVEQDVDMDHSEEQGCRICVSMSALLTGTFFILPGTFHA